MAKRPTLRTIAAASGLALTTVSRALAGDTKIAEGTRARVAGIAAEIGYVPDRAARRLRTGRTDTITLVVAQHDEILGFRGSMIAGLTQAMAGTRFQVSMTPYDAGTDPLRPVRHVVENGLADGIVFSGTAPDDPRVTWLSEAGFPFVSHGRTDLGPHPWCDYDNGAFASMAVARLAARGRRRLFLIPPVMARTYARHMRDGFIAACAGAGVEARMDDGITLDTPPERLHRFVTDIRGIDGYICPGEVAAMAVLAALHDAGCRVGADVDVIAKQTSHVFDLYRPRIDTIYEDIRASGETLGHLLLRRIAGEPAEALQVLLPPVPGFRTG